VIRGLLPLGYTDREKIVRSVLLEHDSADQATPCVVALRIGNSTKLEDPNSTDSRNAPLWNNINPPLRLASANVKTLAQMKAQNLRPGFDPSWLVYERGRYLCWEMTIRNANGTPAIGGRTFWARLDIDASGLPK
jgi:hypothetical protein